MSLMHTIVKPSLATILAIFMLNSAAMANTQCRPPLAPSIPESATATKEEIQTALKAIKGDFQPAIVNFQNCIATEKAAVGDVATPEQIEQWDKLFDYAYALETQVANKMNEAIRAYKERLAAKK